MTRPIVGVRTSYACAMFLGLAVAACSGAEESSIDVIQQSVERPIQATITVSSRWSSGYCASVRVQNTTPVTLASWAVTIQLNASDVSSIWNANRTLVQGQLIATPVTHNAALAPGSSADFGFCASGPTGSGIPSVLGTLGFPLEDASPAASAKLLMKSNWASGYCADIVVSNPSTQTKYGWSVTVDLAESVLTNSWSSQASSSGNRVTFRPLTYNATLAPGGAATVGFCANKTGTIYRPMIVSPATGTPNSLKVAVYVPRRIASCFIGDPCTPGEEGCNGLYDDQGQLVRGFTDATFEAVRTTDPRVYTAGNKECVEMALSQQDREEIGLELAKYRDDVRAWTRGDIELDLRVIEFDRLDMDLSRWGAGVWVPFWNIAEFALPRLDFVPDFNLVIPPIRDPQKGLHHTTDYCGGTYGADFGLGGAGWSWIPKTKGSFWFDCAEQPVLTHEWLHQVHFGYHNLSGFTDIYRDALPACGLNDPDPLRWFPDSHQCGADPDFEACSTGNCVSNDFVDSHILGVHWDPALAFVGNHCKDGVQDFSETGTDTGGACLDGIGAAVESAPASRATPDVATPIPTR